MGTEYIYCDDTDLGGMVVVVDDENIFIVAHIFKKIDAGFVFFFLRKLWG